MNRYNSVNPNDCLTCAFANALQVNYKCIFNSIKITGIVLQSLPNQLMNMKVYPSILARLSKKPLVVIYQVSLNERSAHAVAFRDGRCIDNSAHSRKNNLTLNQLSKQVEILRVYRKGV